MAQATISITVNGEAKEVEATTTGVELFAEDKNIIAVKINGENRDLYTPLNDGDTVDPIALDSEDGLAIMRHSATHVMAQAVQEVYPNAKLGVGPVIKDGFYYDFQVDQPFTPNDLKDIEKRMQRIIKSSQSFRRRSVTEEEALKEEADQPCADTFSDKYAFVGPSIRPATETVEKVHDVLIYISMGTVNNDLLPFYRACIAAFADSPYQVILSTGEQIDRSALGTLPDNITALPHVDQIAVLQKADVFLSHCGMNSASESLYFGVPLVLFPQTNEQGGVAARVAELGAGLKLEKAAAY